MLKELGSGSSNLTPIEVARRVFGGSVPEDVLRRLQRPERLAEHRIRMAGQLRLVGPASTQACKK